MRRTLFDDEHESVRSMAKEFAETEVAPHLEDWNRAGIVDRSLFRKAGAAGLLGMNLPDKYGGGGVDDFRYNVVVNEELTRVGGSAVYMGIGGFNDLCGPYFGDFTDDDQKARWLPGLCSGELISAVAMTEPGAGSDLAGVRTTARRDGADFVLKGAKTFISNGINADLVIVVAKTDPNAGSRGISLLVVERGMTGFERSKTLDKIGLHAQDTAELYFDNVRVPASNVLGEVNEGFGYLRKNLVSERLSIAVNSMTSMEVALSEAVTYTKDRMAFGQRIADFQATRFTLAELATQVQVARVFLDECLAQHVAKQLTETDAAMAKWYVTETQQTVVSKALQLFGGYGFMKEFPVAREFVDARVSTLYGGTTEIMKEIIGRSLVK
ncbi:MAG: acyl-CoA dehydrogenase family protein [Dermatophilaceae bacterium]